MSKHTPGPWKWYWRQEDGLTNCGVFHERKRGMAYSVCRAPLYQTEEIWEADARLIAAAPDLLEALQQIKQRLDTCHLHIMNGHEVFDSFYVEMIDKAIAKATGEA